MLTACEAEVDDKGTIRLLEKIDLPKGRKALVILLPENDHQSELSLMSEQSLARDWLNDDEDAAWAHLQKLT